MKGFDEIQQLWQGQAPEPNVSADAMLQRIKSNRTALTRKFFWQIVGVIIAVATLLWMGLTVNFSTWTTYLALAIMVACICYYFVNQLRDLRDIKNSENLLSKPQDYINYLKAFRKRRNRFNTRNYAIYEACIGLAFALYGIEMYFALPFWTFVGSIIFIALWFVVCHFVFMKQYIKNENTRIAEMIDNLERINKQFKDDNIQ